MKATGAAIVNDMTFLRSASLKHCTNITIGSIDTGRFECIRACYDSRLGDAFAGHDWEPWGSAQAWAGTASAGCGRAAVGDDCGGGADGGSPGLGAWGGRADGGDP